MYTEIGSIAMSLRQKGSRVREVKRKPNGKAKPHRYAQAWSLTAADAVGHFLGINVGTPLQKKLARLAILLFGVAVICAIIVLAANSFSNNSEVIIYAVATGLSMIPASLTVVLTITMAAGTKRMVKRHVIVRNLKSLEALGGVTDICSDKTGTLTQGKMVAKKAWIPAMGTYSVGQSDQPHNPTVGDLSYNPKQPRHIDPDMDEKTQSYEELLKDNPHLVDYLKVASLANLANVHQTDEGQWNARGDPTEIAIQVFASRFQWNRLEHAGGDSPKWRQLAEFPFDSDVKKMSVIFEEVASSKKFVFTKGAVERVIYSCSHVFTDESESIVELEDDYREEILANMESLAAMGLRVLALASKEYDGPAPQKGEDLNRESIEQGLIFRGLVGLYDPPRPETAGSVRQCQKAGIEVHMLTGDHPGTARAIAIEVGIVPSNMSTLPKETTDAMVMTASQFDKLSDDEIDALPLLPLVIARCAPNTKVRMIDALHRRKAFTGMTGDGVNDSPSLKRSDVGIGMGTGSDVAKDASDIVLTDDNFASILNAIEEGRRMFDNIQKFILHLLAQNIAQACVLLIGLAFKDQSGLSVFPVSPVEVMWIIMITSSLPDMGLGFEIAAPDILDRPPQDVSLSSQVIFLDYILTECSSSVVFLHSRSSLTCSSMDSGSLLFALAPSPLSCLASVMVTLDTIATSRTTPLARPSSALVRQPLLALPGSQSSWHGRCWTCVDRSSGCSQGRRNTLRNGLSMSGATSSSSSPSSSPLSPSSPFCISLSSTTQSSGTRESAGNGPLSSLLRSFSSSASSRGSGQSECTSGSKKSRTVVEEGGPSILSRVSLSATLAQLLALTERTLKRSRLSSGRLCLSGALNCCRAMRGPADGYFLLFA